MKNGTRERTPELSCFTMYTETEREKFDNTVLLSLILVKER